MTDDSAMDAVFGKRKRPSSHDFWKLSQIVLKLDGRMDEAAPADKREAFENTISEVIDIESASYMATQRALRAGLPPTRENARTLMLLATVWLDGLTIGLNYAKEDS